eukprot:TRINITY_DN4133_c0_g1_i4.p1 TRINITY_DN4133_c0_g1~~TRINITY_DN4133_c0_g1_i4.p1  ORF type:complete len:265 (+),score=80.50 TRINITY_DN4133_c0_g1_i4:1148-1942(+)
MLRELFRVVPEFYIHRWTALEGRKEPVLILDIPEDFANTLSKLPHELLPLQTAQEIAGAEILHSFGIMKCEVMRQRAELVKERLLNFVLERHGEFLAENCYGEYDPKEKRAWHALFKLNAVSLNEEVELKPIPSLQRKETVNDFIQKNDIRKKSNRIAQEKFGKPLPEDINSFEDSSTDSTMPYLSQELIQKIKIKEKVLHDCEKDVQDKITLTVQSTKDDRLRKLAETLRTIFATQKTSIAPLEDIIGKLKDTDRGVYVSRGS